MGIRDRGKIKWQSAFFMPEHVSMLRDLRREEMKVSKPLLDQNQIEEIEQNILMAMEFTNQVKISIWDNGFLKKHTGILHRLDEINKVIYLETSDGFMVKVLFGNLVRIDIFYMLCIYKNVTSLGRIKEMYLNYWVR